ncbi:MAG: hypothetical protein R2751_19550 [Bacteroidales bacterium]
MYTDFGGESPAGRGTGPFRNPGSGRTGVVIIHQELSLIPS